MTRIGDLEREAARARLVEAYAAGRIDAPELESRAVAVWGAVRSDDLAEVVDDLGESPSPPGRSAPGFVRDLLVFLVCSAVALVVWHLTGRGFFWPVWVIVYTGLSLLRVLNPRSATHTRCDQRS